MKGQKIGGFPGLELPLKTVAKLSVWDHFTAGAAQIVTRATARGALTTLIGAAHPRRIWYPAFFCPEAIVTIPGVPIEFYAVGKELTPDAAVLEPLLRSGDMVVAADFFGVPVGDDFRSMKMRRDDVLWIEDRAQALAPGSPWGDWLIYSPRKLFGVPDGGLAVCKSTSKCLDVAPASAGVDLERTLQRLAPLYSRYSDPQDAQHDKWYDWFRDAECMEIDPQEEMSRLTNEIIRATEVEPVINTRLANAKALFKALPPEFNLYSAMPTTPLLCYPIVIKNRDKIVRELAQRGIFCPVHWRNQLSPCEDFPVEHRLSVDIMSLPCDQRYDTSQMRFIAAQVVQAAQPVNS